MNQNQVVQAMGAENRRLRELISQMQKDHNQGKFLEDLVCAALTGIVGHHGDAIDINTAAEMAVDQAEAVLQVIVTRLSEAQGEDPEAEGEVATP